MRGSKIPVQELWLKMGGGRIREGGRISGILRYVRSNTSSTYVFINHVVCACTYSDSVKIINVYHMLTLIIAHQSRRTE